jgi:hypothetical protein
MCETGGEVGHFTLEPIKMSFRLSKRFYFIIGLLLPAFTLPLQLYLLRRGYHGSYSRYDHLRH